MATMILRWLVACYACVFMAAKAAGENSDNDQSLFYTETKEFLKKRIMEEEILVKFLNQLSKISRGLSLSNRKFAQPLSDSAAKRIGSEFLGKRGTISPAEVAEDEPSAVTTAAMLANHLLNFDTSASKKRLGSEFLGKRGLIGSEFLGKRSFNEHGMTANAADELSDRATTDDSDENSRFHSKK